MLQPLAKVERQDAGFADMERRWELEPVQTVPLAPGSLFAEDHAEDAEVGVFRVLGPAAP